MKISFCGNNSNRIWFLTVFFLCFTLLVVILFFILTRFKPVFVEKASHSAIVHATDIINKSTESVFSDISSDSFVSIDRDSDGNITSVSADSIKMNKFKSTLSKCIQEQAKKSENKIVYIPIGSLTNFAVLQGVGYRIPVNVSTDGFTKIDFEDEFVSCGINQVKHKIFMTVSVRVSVISAVFTKTETVTAQIPVAETVISGTVPVYYGDNMSILGR